MLRFLTAGESHGAAEIAILEGIPAGLTLAINDIQPELDRRMSGAGRGGRGQIEKDRIKILSGVRLGKTIGAPITLYVENIDFANWQQPMSPVTNPRPGHADLAGILKYNFDDIRNVIERASARETIMRVAVGAVCKKLLAEFNIKFASHTVQIGNIKSNTQVASFEQLQSVDKIDPQVRCLNRRLGQQMKDAIIEATKKKETLGGIIEVVVHNVPVGLGSYVHYDRKLDGRIAQMLMSIPSVKAVEIGNGIQISALYGSEVHDEISYHGKSFYRPTNRAGGIEGGVSNGEDIICRVYHKPLSSLGNPLNSVDIKTKKETKGVVERSDICIVPRAGVISEAALAYVLANTLIEKFGGDSVSELRRNYEGFYHQITTI